MSQEIQLEFNLDEKSSDQMHIFHMQKQIDEMGESMGKVRRRLFSELGEMKKLFANLQRENDELKNMIKELKNEDQTEWAYCQNGYLFDVKEYSRAAG